MFSGINFLMEIKPKLHAHFWFQIFVVLAFTILDKDSSEFSLLNKVRKGQLFSKFLVKAKTKLCKVTVIANKDLISCGYNWFYCTT